MVPWMVHRMTLFEGIRPYYALEQPQVARESFYLGAAPALVTVSLAPFIFFLWCLYSLAVKGFLFVLF